MTAISFACIAHNAKAALGMNGVSSLYAPARSLWPLINVTVTCLDRVAKEPITIVDEECRPKVTSLGLHAFQMDLISLLSRALVLYCASLCCVVVYLPSQTCLHFTATREMEKIEVSLPPAIPYNVRLPFMQTSRLVSVTGSKLFVCKYPEHRDEAFGVRCQFSVPHRASQCSILFGWMDSRVIRPERKSLTSSTRLTFTPATQHGPGDVVPGHPCDSRTYLLSSDSTLLELQLWDERIPLIDHRRELRRIDCERDTDYGGEGTSLVSFK
ncbi:uncharacterized protein EDB91DRAFT_645713 [Suillus paluster]|uniref:uncharacterized protein n=1 Tax=Suillus paluster TaxID=48578 RepID=UPI001B870A17|nr:uncharacterized protein EDB91DRAFT_645713 [Suillus paluster]KAG1733201.1 hypothetical protein EDB91DRAFT_645713 [Suillus paluster]